MRAVATPSELRRAVTHLRRGGLLIYPTETAYALGCDATNANAVAAVFRVKGRERAKSLPLIAASVGMVRRYVRWSSSAGRLARSYWPGPLTVVAESRGSDLGARLARGVVARDGSIAFRVSSHPIARALSRRLGRPVVSTSANRSGTPSCYSVRAALRSLRVSSHLFPLPTGGGGRGGGGILSVFDVGSLPRRRPSTIVDARGERPLVLRRGGIRLTRRVIAGRAKQ